MSYQLLERPYKYVFSNNPVRYRFNVSNPNTPGSAMEVALYILGINTADPRNTAGTLVTKQTLTPNPDGTVDFYCEDYLNSQLDWQLPALTTDDIIAVQNQIKWFYIEYRQVTKANQSPTWSSDQYNVRIVLKGGVAKEKWDRNNFFINHLPTKKPFLTWLPDKHFVGLEERRYLTYFHSLDVPFPDDGQVSLTTPQLQARVVYTDGTEELVTKDFPALSESRLFHLPAGLKQLGLDNLHPDKQIWYYDVSVKDIGDINGTLLANTYRLYADYRKFYDPFSFIYHNSLGGMDTMRMKGDYDTDINLSKTDIQKATGGDFSSEVLPVENDSINITGYKTYDGDAGWQNTKQMREAMEDLLYSDGVYREVFGRWLKVVIMGNTQKGPSKEDTKWSFPIKWRYTFDNSQFTPFDTGFGAGNNAEAPGPIYGICTAPSGLAVELTDDQPAQKTYTLSWDAVADAEEYEIVVTDPNGNDTVIPVNATSYNLVVTLAGDYSWKVRTKCGENDYSGYSQGQGFTAQFAALSCNSPAALMVDLISIEGDNATVRFSYAAVAGVFGYVIEYREVGSSVWQNHFNPAGVLSVDIVLKKDVQYECRLRSSCDGTDYGPWVYGPNFIPSNMVGGCAVPSNLRVFLFPSNLVQVYRAVAFDWDGGAGNGSYTLEYKTVGSSVWTTVSGINAKEYIAPFLYRNLQYEWKVFSQCAGGGISPTAIGPNFNT